MFNALIFSSFSDAEKELNKLAELAEKINSQISSDEQFASNNAQNVDLDQLFNFLSQVSSYKIATILRSLNYFH